MTFETFGYNDIPSGAQNVALGEYLWCDMSTTSDVDYFRFSLANHSHVILYVDLSSFDDWLSNPIVVSISTTGYGAVESYILSADTFGSFASLFSPGSYYIWFSRDDPFEYDEYSADYTFSVTASLVDLVSPAVLVFSPADEAVGVAITSNIVITFNEAIQRGTGNIILKTAGGTVVATYDAASSPNLSASGNTLTINPTADLAYDTGYVVEFAAGSIKDLAGNSYAGTTAYNFATTAAPDDVAPTTLTFSPADEATSVAIGTNVLVTFSEAIQRGTGDIVLKTAGGLTVETYNAASSGDLTISGSTLTINPTADLAYGTGYVVEFAAGSIKDMAGNSYAGTTAYNFATTTGLLVTGTADDDYLLGSIGADTMDGGAGNDTLIGDAGSDTLNGGLGIDVALYSGPRANYVVMAVDGAHTEIGIDGVPGFDTLLDVERLQFDDVAVAFDVDGGPGDWVKLLGVLAGPSVAAHPYYRGIGIGYLDQGVSLTLLTAGALDAVLGASSNSSTAIVTMVYMSIAGVSPPPADLAYYAGLIDGGAVSREQFTILASEVAYNLTNVGFAGLAATGIDYLG
jgi:methionine-rich copper-binding protein CopC